MKKIKVIDDSEFQKQIDELGKRLKDDEGKKTQISVSEYGALTKSKRGVI